MHFLISLSGPIAVLNQIVVLKVIFIVKTGRLTPQMDPDIHSRNGLGMGIKKLLKKLVVSEMHQKIRNLRVSKKVEFLMTVAGCSFYISLGVRMLTP